MEKDVSKDLKCEYKVDGMHCAACELYVERKLQESGKATKVNASLNTGKISFELKEDIDKEAFIKQINKEIDEDGYKLVNPNENIVTTKTDKTQILLISLTIAFTVVIIYLLIQKIGFSKILGSQNSQYTFAFIYGLVASVSSCMAVVGSVVLSISSAYSKTESKVVPLTSFHISRIVSFVFLGGLLGLFGSIFTFNNWFYLIINTILFIVMVIMGLSLTELFPALDKYQIRLPKSLASKMLDINSNSSKYLIPALLGLITFILPCGFTQSMQFQAIASGDLVTGALLMGIYALGTFPVLALISLTSVKLSNGKNKDIFFMTAGILIVLFASYTYYVFVANTILPIFY